MAANGKVAWFEITADSTAGVGSAYFRHPDGSSFSVYRFTSPSDS